jgi:hypothetical protein
MKPDIRDGDWVRLVDRDYVAIAGSVRRMGRGWQVSVVRPTTVIEYSGHIHMAMEQTWINVKRIVEIRRAE